MYYLPLFPFWKNEFVFEVVDAGMKLGRPEDDDPSWAEGTCRTNRTEKLEAVGKTTII